MVYTVVGYDGMAHNVKGLQHLCSKDAAPLLCSLYFNLHTFDGMQLIATQYAGHQYLLFRGGLRKRGLFDTDRGH